MVVVVVVCVVVCVVWCGVVWCGVVWCGEEGEGGGVREAWWCVWGREGGEGEREEEEVHLRRVALRRSCGGTPFSSSHGRGLRRTASRCPASKRRHAS